MALTKATPLAVLLLATLALATPPSGESHSSYSSSDPESLAEQLSAAATEGRVQRAHGILGCLAFALFFPLGAILLRTLPGRLSLILHIAVQLLALVFALATLGMGIWMAWENPYMSTYHAIIGIVVIAAVCLQPATGIFHHIQYKRTQGRTVVSYAHIGWGIAVVTLGTINGGFGLELAGSAKKYMIVYGVFAALIWLVWMGVSFLSQLKRGTSGRGRARDEHVDVEAKPMRESSARNSSVREPSS